MFINGSDMIMYVLSNSRIGENESFPKRKEEIL